MKLLWLMLTHMYVGQSVPSRVHDCDKDRLFQVKIITWTGLLGLWWKQSGSQRKFWIKYNQLEHTNPANIVLSFFLLHISGHHLLQSSWTQGGHWVSGWGWGFCRCAFEVLSKYLKGRFEDTCPVPSVCHTILPQKVRSLWCVGWYKGSDIFHYLCTFWSTKVNVEMV